MRVLVFRHEPSVDLGTIRPALEARGVTVETVDRWTGAPLPELSAANGLIVLGGTMCANDDLPFLRDELAAIRDAAERGQPVFGVCLGAQMIAKALGAKVHRNGAVETGWHNVQLDPAAATDAVFSEAPQSPRVFQAHHDTFDLPAGAVRLATSEACANQAFRFGHAIYGVQFHPEMTVEMIEEWRPGMGLPKSAETPESCSRMARTCEQLFTGWSRLL